MSSHSHYMRMAQSAYNEAIKLPALPKADSEEYSDSVRKLALATREYFFGIFSALLEERGKELDPADTAKSYYTRTAPEVLALHLLLPREEQEPGAIWLGKVVQRIGE